MNTTLSSALAAAMIAFSAQAVHVTNDDATTGAPGVFTANNVGGIGNPTAPGPDPVPVTPAPWDTDATAGTVPADQDTTGAISAYDVASAAGHVGDVPGTFTDPIPETFPDPVPGTFTDPVPETFTDPVPGTFTDPDASAGHGTEAEQELFIELDTSLHIDTFLSEDTVAARQAYYESLAKDVAVVMIERVNPQVASEYLGFPVEAITDPVWQTAAENAIADYFSDPEQGFVVDGMPQMIAQISEIQIAAIEEWIRKQPWPELFQQLASEMPDYDDSVYSMLFGEDESELIAMFTDYFACMQMSPEEMADYVASLETMPYEEILKLLVEASQCGADSESSTLPDVDVSALSNKAQMEITFAHLF